MTVEECLNHESSFAGRRYHPLTQPISRTNTNIHLPKSCSLHQGVGVTDATALSAALVWVTKDGIGMIGSLVFAYHCADLFEVNVKEWRLLADALNNFGLTLDLCASMFPPSFFLLVTSVSTLSKSLCGLIAGATKARISAHFALKGHLADITAKESTQETAVALVGLVVGMVCASYVAEDVAVTWGVFIVLLLLHQWANYQLIRVLVLDTLNPQRIHIITKRCLEASTKDTRSSSHSPIPSPAPSSFPSPNDVAHAERLFVPIWLHWRGPRIGCPLLALFPAHLACNALGVYKGDHQGDNGEAARQHWERLRGLWEGQGFVVGVGDDGQAVACLGDDCGDAAMVKAYFVCCYLHEHWGAHTSPPQRWSYTPITPNFPHHPLTITVEP